MSNITKVALAGIAVLVLCGALMLLRGSLQRKPPPKALPKVTVGVGVVGTPWQWRVLDSKPISKVKMPTREAAEQNSGMLGGLVAGNFDRDPDQELVLIRLAEGRIYEADGNSQPVTLHGHGFFMDLTAWDYDGDGTDEIVPDGIQYSVATNYKPGSNAPPPPVPTTTPVFKLDGTRIATLQGFRNLTSLTGDLDGDGHNELVLSSGPTWFVHSINGKSQSVAGNKYGLPPVAIADPLDQGHAGIIVAEKHGRNLVLRDARGNKLPLGSLNFTALFAVPADTDGNKRDDLLFGAEGYFRDGKWFAPFSYQDALMPSTCKAVVVDVPGSHTKQVAVLEGKNIPTDELVIYDLFGKVVHQERIIGGVWSMAALHSGRKDYLCLQLSDKLLIYP